MPRCIVSILLGGVVAGSIDIGAACLINSVSVPIILKAIAAGILGKASFQGGAGLASGVVIFVVMTYVVVPLSAVGHIPRFNAARFAENILAMLLFGLIVSYFAREQSADRP